MFNFEKLDVWQKSVALADAIYLQTRAFPTEERFGLTNQMRRAAVSISSNIAEGSSRMSKADFGRFLELAAGSVLNLLPKLSSRKNSVSCRKRNFARFIQLRRN